MLIFAQNLRTKIPASTK